MSRSGSQPFYQNPSQGLNLSSSSNMNNANNSITNQQSRWSSNEEESCVRALDRLVVSTRQNHESESNSAESRSDFVLEQQRARELQELKLFAEAVHGQDVIGLTALTTGFWSHKNALSRQKHLLEKVLPRKDEADGLLDDLRRLQLQAEDPEDVASIAKLIDTVQRANFVELAKHATQVQHRLCENSPMVAAYKALGGAQMGSVKNSGLALLEGNKSLINAHISPNKQNSSATASALIRPASNNNHLTLNEEGQENRLGECVRIADASLQDAEMRANQLREQLADLFAGFEQLKLPRAMHSFIPRTIATGEASAPRAASIRHQPNASFQQNTNSVSRQASTAAGNNNNNNNNSFQPHPLLNGYTTMHLLRVLCVEASVNDTPEGLATQFGVEPNCITDVHQQPLEPSQCFAEPTKVLIHIGNPMRGLEESLTALDRRIELIDRTTLPRAKERLVVAREALWSAELQALQAPLRGDGGVTERRRAVEQLERDLRRAEEVLEQCKIHREALLAADFGRISFLLEAKQLEALEGLGSSERLVYTGKEIPKGVSVAQFADRLGIPAGELITFVDEDNDVTMAYVPTLVPRKSLMILDEELRKEYNNFKTAHPELPPRKDLLEHLSALRAGDVASLSDMLCQVRRQHDLSDDGKAKVTIDELRVQLTKLDELREQNARMLNARDDTIMLLRTQNDELRFAVTAAKERAGASDGALQQSKNESADLDDACRELQSRCAALTENLQSTEHRCQNLQRDLQQLHQVHEQNVRDLSRNSKDEMDALSANRSAMESRIDQLVSKVDLQQGEIAGLAKKLETAFQQRDEARQSMDNLRTRLAETNVEVKNSATLQSEKHNIQAQLDLANAELAEIKRRNDEQVENLKQQVRVAENKLQQSEQRAKKMEEENSRATQARDLQLASLHEGDKKAVKEANAAREAAEHEVTVLRRSLQEVQGELARARAVRSRNPGSPTAANSNEIDSAQNNQSAPSLLQPGAYSPSRGLLDPPLLAGNNASASRQRVLYVCRPMPRGTTPNQIASEFGVSRADLLGPFTETHSGEQFVYVPTLVDGSNSDIVRQDERLRAAIIAGSRDGGLPSVALLEALHALRSGDIATLAEKIIDGEERVAKAEALLALQARSDALAGISRRPEDHDDDEPPQYDHRASMPHLDVADTQALLDDDFTYDSIEILREKIALLKEALAAMRGRVSEWKDLADEYHRQLVAEQTDDVTAEQVKADYEHRLESKIRQMQGLEHEVQQLKSDSAAAERRKDEELKVMQLARQKLLAEKDQTIFGLRKQNDDLRQEKSHLVHLLEQKHDE